MRCFKSRVAVCVMALFLLAIAPRAWAGSIFLTGHDPDFHAFVGGNAAGAVNLNNAAIDFIMDPGFNGFLATAPKFLFVESNIAPPGGHVVGEDGIVASGYTAGVDYDQVDASGLDAALDLLGVAGGYSGLVIASDFGGILTQAELDILNARSGDIIDFLNAGGGLYAMAESNNGAGLTPGGGQFGFLPFIVTSAALDQSEVGFTVTPFGASLGLVSDDINGNASHNIFNSAFGLNVVDFDAQGNIMSIAGRAQVGPGGVVPEPASLLLLGSGLVALAARRRRPRA